MPLNNSSFNLREIQDTIRKHGEHVNYFRGHKCTCTLLQTGTSYGDPNRADPNCAACHGYGIVWISSGQIIGLVTNISQEKELLQAGIASAGDLVFSPDLQQTLSDWDKIQLTWSDGVPWEGQLIQRGTGTTDEAMYNVVSVPPDGCIAVDPTTGNITTYTADVDFSYSGQTITWGLSSNQPQANAFYSLKYNAQLDWIVFTPPQPRRERGTNLGQKVILRKKHMVFNGV